MNSIKRLNSSIWPIDRTQTGSTTSGQSGPRSNGNEEVLHIFQHSRTGVWPSHGFVSYPGHTLGRSWPPAKVQLVFSATPANLAGWDAGFYYWVLHVIMWSCCPLISSSRECLYYHLLFLFSGYQPICFWFPNPDFIWRFVLYLFEFRSSAEDLISTLSGVDLNESKAGNESSLVSQHLIKTLLLFEFMSFGVMQG